MTKLTLLGIVAHTEFFKPLKHQEILIDLFGHFTLGVFVLTTLLHLI